MSKYVIGIDPDCERSGYGVVNMETGEVVDAGACDFPTLFDVMDVWRRGDKVSVYIEGGWLNNGNWHLLGRMTVARAAAIGRSVGRNHQTGMLIEQMARRMGYDVRVVKPLRKCWRGKDGKITAKELQAVTSYAKRCNQDARDAVLLAWVYAGLPVRVRARASPRQI